MALSIASHRDALRRDTGRFLIGGAWREPQGTEIQHHLHPATNERVASWPVGSAADVAAAVLAARHAFDAGPWPGLKARERRRCFRRMVDTLEAHSDELARLQTLDNAMPIRFSASYRVSGAFAADVFDYYAGWIDKIAGEVAPQFTDQVPMQFLSVREPIGVVAAITPWNAPLLQISVKLAAALACGNTVVLKPSEYASLAAIRFVELLQETDLPPGVVNLVLGAGATGDALVRHPGVDKITFTGSRAVGGHILATSGKDIKRVTLELGGKSAALVFPDAPSVEWAAQSCMAMLSMGLSGQVCSTTSRALVHRSIHDAFLEHAERQIEAVRFGDPFDEATTSAPMINARGVEKVMGFIESGQREGARLVFGGDRPNGELSNGNWINPTLFADVRPDMTIAQEEIFGPVLSVIPFDDEEEAVRIANDTRYGLSSGIYSTNIARVWRVARGLRSGTVGVNGYSAMPNASFGGFKESGIGREGGFAAIESFTELKTIILNLAV